MHLGNIILPSSTSLHSSYEVVFQLLVYVVFKSSTTGALCTALIVYPDV